MEGELDTADLPAELAERAERVLRPDRLAAAGAPRHAGAADTTVYDVRVTSERGADAFQVEEPSADPEVLAVLRDVMAEVVRRRKTS